MSKIGRKLNRNTKSNTMKKHEVFHLLDEAEKLQFSHQYDSAQQIYKKALKLDPKNHNVLNRYGYFLARYRNNYHQAQSYLEQAFHLKPDELKYIIDLAWFYNELNLWDQLEEVSEICMEKMPENHIPYYYKGCALRAQKQYPGSIENLAKAIRILPTFDAAHVELCAVYEELGDRDNLRHQLDQLRNLLKNVKEGQKIIDISYVLGKYYDIFEEYDTAFQYFKIANDLRWSQKPYDLTKDIEYVRKIKSVCEKQYLKRHSGNGYSNPHLTPIFIIGMPRSGTSLVEQIFSTHPEVSPAGELTDFYDISVKYDFSQPNHYYLHGNEYIHHLMKFKAAEATHVTDKMPTNFWYVGLIKLALPNAKILHCVRDPMDTCFSCYKQGFAVEQFHTCDLETLGRYFLLYQELMDHWHKIMPGFIHDISYEKLVNDFEAEMRTAFSFCDLSWHNSCRDYFKTSRRIKTASRDQITKPIYTSSVERWKKYEKYLQPLYNVLHPNESMNE